MKKYLMLASCALTLTACHEDISSFDFLAEGFTNSLTKSSAASTDAVLFVDDGDLVIQENAGGFCSLDGNIQSNHSGYTGDGFANTINAQGNSITWNVELNSATSFVLEWRYANGSSDNRTGTVSVNGKSQGQVSFPTTGSWSSWTVTTATVSLDSGDNEIVLSADLSSGLANIDYLAFQGSASTSLVVGDCNPTTDPGTDPEPPTGNAQERVRVINTTDLGADPDDKQSMVRQLVMANEFDIEGLIVATGCWRKSQSNTSLLDAIVSAYEQSYSNLSTHAEGFPTPAYLKSISVMGQTGYGMNDVGSGKDSAGSELIIAAVDKDDPRPVWATCWGGCNTIAQALWKVKNTRSTAELNEFISKLRVFDVLGQDNAGTWMAKTFPNLLYIRATSVYGWAPSDSYLDTHIQNHGPLGAAYPDRKYATEGDTPSFMHLANPGLNDPEKVSQGGWGGRFNDYESTAIRGMSCMSGEDAAYDPYYMHGNTSEGSGAISRWSTAYNNDFQARMDWSIQSSYSSANHHPLPVVNGNEAEAVTYMTASAGSQVSLSANGSSDPDGNSLSYSWEFYNEPSSYSGSVSINNSSSSNATVNIPSGASGKDIHIILTLKDNGSPNLFAYRRVVISVQ